jgi:hypothetical protein
VVKGDSVSTDIVYAVRFGSWFAETIWGRSRDSQREGDSGAQIRPLVCRIMKAIFWGVRSAAAMIRSPSFSRERSSRTTMNSPFSGGSSQCVCAERPGLRGWVGRTEGNWGVREFTKCLDCVFYGVKLLGNGCWHAELYVLWNFEEKLPRAGFKVFMSLQGGVTKVWLETAANSSSRSELASVNEEKGKVKYPRKPPLCGKERRL